LVQIFSWAPYSRKPSVNALLLWFPTDCAVQDSTLFGSGIFHHCPHLPWSRQASCETGRISLPCGSAAGAWRW
jgi:hypothetical protein